MTTPRPHPPSCPRCGYDLSGAIAAWKLTCPLSTICTECGLPFELRLVLNERLRNQTEFFEATPRHTLRFFLKTVRRALNPWLFWRWVAMELQPRYAWMYLGVLGGILTVELSCILATAILVAISIIPRLLSAAGPNSLYVSSWLSEPIDRFERLLTPWLDDSWGWSESRSGSFILLAILTQLTIPLTFLLLPETLRKARVLRSHLVRIWAWSFVAVPLLLSAFSFAGLILGFIEWLADLAGVQPLVSDGLDQLVRAFARQQHWFFLAILCAWTLLWWNLAVGRYLKLPTPRLITLCMFTIALLFSILISIFIPGVGYDLVLSY